jgi:hypothetical protein
MCNTDLTKTGVELESSQKARVPASYKTPTALLIFTFNSGKRLGNDGEKKTNIPASSAYGVYAPQLIGYSIACAPNSDVLYRTQPLTQKLIKQGCAANRLKSSLHYVYGGHPNLVDRCEM